MAVPSLLSTLTISITPVRPGSRWFGLPPRGLPGLVFATTALSSGLMDGIPFSALVLMVTVTTVLGLLLLERRLARCDQAQISTSSLG
ncbi:MAG: hypothetical protein WCQ20_01460 [Synechococcaceae cyanobacterium ELA739]